MIPIELLCPAKNLEIGKEAILNGADAVYIGGPSFGARSAAGNKVEDIEELCRFAHLYGARVYVTLNTILYDDELLEVERLIHRLYAAGVDALITQDLALLKLQLPPIALHASTQMDNCTSEWARFLEKAGFSQIVLARELSINEIKAVHKATSLPLEAFVHGALCVSYSGRCYASQYCFNRSANRGRCAQFCRLAFQLIDADGKVISTKYHLSLRDMNRSAHLEDMMDAGVRSFKIEGRLKDINYVKNLTAFYRRSIDDILARRKGEYCRSSYGRSYFGFTPQLERTFNRGFTTYFLHGRTKDLASLQTPKAIGAPVGRVSRMGRRSFFVESQVEFANGDGICFFDDEGRLQGFRVNRVDHGELFPQSLPTSLRVGTELYRNEDRVFEKTLAKTPTQRLLSMQITLEPTADDNILRLCAKVENGAVADLLVECENMKAQTPQTANIVKQLSRLGGTPFTATSVVSRISDERFIPSSLLSEWRRMLIERLTQASLDIHQRDKRRPMAKDLDVMGKHFDHTANIANRLSAEWLLEHGATEVASAYEINPVVTAPIMTCRYCIRYAHNQCLKQAGHQPRWKSPLSLRLPDGRVFPLRFDCDKCEMSVLHP